MGGHIRMDKDLKEDPRVLKLTDAVLDDWISKGMPTTCRVTLKSHARNAVMGFLYSVWRYADTYLQTGDVTEVSVTDLADVTGMSVTVIEKMPPEWLKAREDNAIELPGFTDKNALITKDLRREQNKIRQARHREKKRQERNALLSQESNAGNSPSRGRAHARAQAPPGPVPPNRTPGSEERQSPGSAYAELTSAHGRIARRIPGEKNGSGQPQKSQAELEADALKLAAAGMDSAGIVHNLAQYGVDAHQVTLWLANAPAKPS